MIEINWTLIFAFVNFGLLYFLLRMFLFKPVQNLLDARKRQIDEAFAAASANEQAAEKARTEYEGKLAELMEGAEATLENAKTEGRNIQTEMLARAEQEVAELRARAEAEIEHWKQRAFAELRQQIVSMSLEAASRCIATAKTPRIQREQIEALLAGIDQESR